MLIKDGYFPAAHAHVTETRGALVYYIGIAIALANAGRCYCVHPPVSSIGMNLNACSLHDDLQALVACRMRKVASRFACTWDSIG